MLPRSGPALPPPRVNRRCQSQPSRNPALSRPRLPSYAHRARHCNPVPRHQLAVTGWGRAWAVRGLSKMSWPRARHAACTAYSLLPCRPSASTSPRTPPSLTSTRRFASTCQGRGWEGRGRDERRVDGRMTFASLAMSACQQGACPYKLASICSVQAGLRLLTTLTSCPAGLHLLSARLAAFSSLPGWLPSPQCR